VAIIRPNPDVLDPRYLRYYLNSPAMQAEMLKLAAAGATRPALTKGMIEDFTIAAPSIERQRTIAALLGSLDRKIELNHRMATTIERLARVVFRAACVDFTHAVELTDSAIGPIPAGWRLVELSSIVEAIRLPVELTQGNGDAPYIGLDAMPRGSTILDQWGRRAEVAGTTLAFRAGDILFGKLRPYFRKVGIAPVDGSCSTEIVVLRPRSEMDFMLALGHVSSQDFIDHCNAISTGTRMPRAEWSSAGIYPVAVPSDSAQLARPNALVAALYDRVLALVAESTRLGELRDALLPKLISGEIELREEMVADRARSSAEHGVAVA
jgi:type I restriction enzyme S subunit